jgi:hypothetical protein
MATPMNQRLRWTTIPRLVFAGWRPNRNVWARLKLPASFEVFPEARRILSRFGGLKFGDRNELARLDPSSGDEVSDQIRACEKLLGRRLYPLGYREHQDREYVLVDEAGTVYLLAGDTLHLLAASFEIAIDDLARCVIRRRAADDVVGQLGHPHDCNSLAGNGEVI